MRPHLQAPSAPKDTWTHPGTCTTGCVCQRWLHGPTAQHPSLYEALVSAGWGAVCGSDAVRERSHRLRCGQSEDTRVASVL